MKRPLITIIALIFAIAGCKIDESGLPQKTSNPLLIGTWYVKAQLTADPLFGTDIQTGFTTQDYYVFNSDNTIKTSMSLPAMTTNSRYTYLASTSGEQITIGNAGGSGFTTFTVGKLTADSLIMTTTLTGTATGLTTTTTTVPITYKFAHK